MKKTGQSRAKHIRSRKGRTEQMMKKTPTRLDEPEVALEVGGGKSIKRDAFFVFSCFYLSTSMSLR